MPEFTPIRSIKRPVVGVRIPEWATFARPIFDGILDHMRLRGWWDLQTENDAHGEIEAFRIDKDWTGDGLITFRCTEEELAAWKSRGIAVVNISSEGPVGGFPRVIPDNAEVGRLAARHLRECGLENFAYVSRGVSVYDKRKEWITGERRYGRERFAGFSEELARTGHKPEALFLSRIQYDSPVAWLDVMREINAFLATLPRPCGVFVVDDLLGVSLLRAAVGRGIPVPADLSVVAFGDDKVFCQLVAPALSSVRYPGREIGLEAARLLAMQLDGARPGEIESVVPVTSVTRRESSDFLSITDAETARLVRLIRDRAPHEPLQAAEVFDATTLSPTVVKSRFNTALGHGPKQEILNVRIAHLRRLLGDTAFPLQDIAAGMGFASTAEMSRFYERHTGLKPSGTRRGER